MCVLLLTFTFSYYNSSTYKNYIFTTEKCNDDGAVSQERYELSCLNRFVIIPSNSHALKNFTMNSNY